MLGASSLRDLNYVSDGGPHRGYLDILFDFSVFLR
jgi:hypothetical protein